MYGLHCDFNDRFNGFLQESVLCDMGVHLIVFEQHTLGYLLEECGVRLGYNYNLMYENTHYTNMLESG